MVKLHCINKKAFQIIKIKLKSLNLHNFTSAFYKFNKNDMFRAFLTMFY